MTCVKKPYKTRAAALRAALGSSRSFGKAFRIYPCSECKCLHVTSRTKPRRNR